ncbi:TNF receptor-associated factor family protein DDB_G0272348-like [Monomorium pharaonis]|uniref:TNF receptor-associated factor family protein DDB_G0272348-like n=1 Tax=Monomorium pharaonis TaxID=307658 RepID=UPI001746C71D|nr:TNF receptor-associated factor family protein DDB_G0272348-like [Monomorium pharaonis]XP_036144062.1 TNF receptor-associated factor family protein DDB_G0272348-like [Monomorium pharaonis]
MMNPSTSNTTGQRKLCRRGVQQSQTSGQQESGQQQESEQQQESGQQQELGQESEQQQAQQQQQLQNQQSSQQSQQRIMEIRNQMMILRRELQQEQQNAGSPSNYYRGRGGGRIYIRGRGRGRDRGDTIIIYQKEASFYF